MYPYLCMQKYLCMHYMPYCVLCQILYSNICTSHVHMDMYTRPLGRLATEGYLPSNPDSDVQSLSQFHVGKWVTPPTHTHRSTDIYILFIYIQILYIYIELIISCRFTVDRYFVRVASKMGRAATCGHLVPGTGPTMTPVRL